MSKESYPNAVAVFCGSSPGTEQAFVHAAQSLGHAIAREEIDFVYGGGSKGLMGVVSGAALEGGANVLGVVPYAMVKDTKEVRKDRKSDNFVFLNEHGRDKVQTLVVHSMHERKVEMAKRVRGFFGLPGGYGTFEELLEMITWTQLGIHAKPIVLLNVLGFYNPLRDLIRGGIKTGFIQPSNENIVIFIDGPSEYSKHSTYDWGTVATTALDSWVNPAEHSLGFDWKKRLPGEKEKDSPLDIS